MYQANLSYAQFEKYLKCLLDGGLVEGDVGCGYLITRRGEEFLRAYACYLERCSQTMDAVERTSKERQLIEEFFFNSKVDGRT
jgi:predicted transcriptional regulator